jgi:hypothetical protein
MRQQNLAVNTTVPIQSDQTLQQKFMHPRKNLYGKTKKRKSVWAIRKRLEAETTLMLSETGFRLETKPMWIL